MSFIKLQDGRSIYALDSIRLRNQKEPTIAPQANTLELYMKDGELYQINAEGVERLVTGNVNTSIPDRSISNIKIQLASLTAAEIANQTITSTQIATDTITANEIADNTITLDKLASSVVDLLVPKGSISAFAGTAEPSGWLLCHGQSLSQVEYAQLYAVVGTAYGNGTTGTVVGTPGGSRFNLPDLRGRFLRGVDGSAGNDPGSASRTAMATGGNTGNNLGSIQADQFQAHQHNYTPPSPGTAIANINGVNAGTTINSGTTANYVTDGLNGTPRTGSETRPKNIYVNYIIKV